MKNPVFVLSLFDTGYYAARQLKKLGTDIIGFDSSTKNSGFFSNFIKAVKCPNPQTHDQELLDLLLLKRKAYEFKPILIPASEQFVFFVNKYFYQLKEEFLFIQPEKKILDGLLNKETQLFLAEKLGLNIAPIISLDLENKQFPDIEKPVIIRAADQVLWKNNIAEKAIIVKNTKELKHVTNKLFNKNVNFICQEVIPGDITNNYEFNALMINGHIIHSHIIQKLYQYPLGFGAACAVRIVNNEIVEEMGNKFISANKLEGFSNTEFKYDLVSDRYYFIETNLRIWQQIELSSEIGFNMMAYYYNFLTKNEKTTVNIISKEKIWIDLPSMLLLFKKYRHVSGLNFFNLMKYLFGANNYGVFKLNDLKPFLKTVVFKF